VYSSIDIFRPKIANEVRQKPSLTMTLRTLLPILRRAAKQSGRAIYQSLIFLFELSRLSTRKSLEILATSRPKNSSRSLVIPSAENKDRRGREKKRKRETKKKRERETGGRVWNRGGAAMNEKNSIPPR